MVASFYRVAVGMWKIAPGEFWTMSPQEFWELESVFRPPEMIGNMKKSTFEHLVGVLNAS